VGEHIAERLGERITSCVRTNTAASATSGIAASSIADSMSVTLPHPFAATRSRAWLSISGLRSIPIRHPSGPICSSINAKVSPVPQATSITV